jgi:hypothetical protein|tara:strand:+ start:2106 stop:2366 length:261 start_codon:yes stop_codon:yes gene_type:complete
MTVTDEKLWKLIDSKAWKDFDAWSQDGWQVKKGEKAYAINGYSLFNKSQVHRPKWHKEGCTVLPDGLDVCDVGNFTGEHCAMDFYS